VNTFASINTVYRFRKVTYYTVTVSGQADSLASQFIKSHSAPEHIESMGIMRKYLEVIGNEAGASQKYFRHEGYAGGDIIIDNENRTLIFDSDYKLEL